MATSRRKERGSWYPARIVHRAPCIASINSVAKSVIASAEGDHDYKLHEEEREGQTETIARLTVDGPQNIKRSQQRSRFKPKELAEGNHSLETSSWPTPEQATSNTQATPKPSVKRRPKKSMEGSMYQTSTRDKLKWIPKMQATDTSVGSEEKAKETSDARTWASVLVSKMPDDEVALIDQDVVVEASSRVAARRKTKAAIRKAKAEITDTIAHANSAQSKRCTLLRHSLQQIVYGRILNLVRISFLSLSQLNHIFDQIAKGGDFRWFAGRSILDFKINGEQTISLEQPYSVLQPLVATMIALASRTMEEHEELAIIQLIINYFKDGGDEVKPHRHRCRQICVALGSARELEVEGRPLVMSHGDILPLNQDMHSVPPSRRAVAPRISVCMFYGSVEEFQNKAISVNANDGWFGESYWWNHPKDMTESKGKGSGKSVGGYARRSVLGHSAGRGMGRGKRG